MSRMINSQRLTVNRRIERMRSKWVVATDIYMSLNTISVSAQIDRVLVKKLQYLLVSFTTYLNQYL